MSVERQHWWNYLGPWPIRPVLGGSVAFVVTAQIFSGVTVNSGSTSFAQSAAITVVPSAVTGIVMWAALALGRRMRALLARSLGTYLLWLVLASVAAVLARYAVTHLPYFPDPDAVERIIPSALRYAVWIVGTLAVAGTLTADLAHRAQQTQDALDLARHQQDLLLESDERSRRQISMVLHDRVQAGVIAAALELRLIQGQDFAADRVRRDAAIDRLESLRSIDLRRAARALSPDLWNVDLRAALMELAQTYEPTMRTRIDAEPGLIAGGHIPEPVLLACYRIVEQGLLNAAIHGEATSVRVVVAVNKHAVDVSIADNGRGLTASSPEPGLGSTVVAAWCRRLNGEWSLSFDTPGASAVLRAHLRSVTPSR